MNFAKFLRTLFSQNTSKRLLLDNQRQPRPLLKPWQIVMILPKLRIGYLIFKYLNRSQIRFKCITFHYKGSKSSSLFCRNEQNLSFYKPGTVKSQLLYCFFSLTYTLKVLVGGEFYRLPFGPYKQIMLEF